MDEEKSDILPEEKEEKVEEKVEEKKEEKSKDEFVKGDENVSAGKHNQTVRKLREAELEKRELEKQLEDVKKAKPVKEESKEDEEEEDIFEEEEKPKKKEKLPDISSLIDEKVKPVLERLNQKEANDKKNQRTAFFEAHPKYLTNSEAWQELLDEMDNSLNPNSKDSYYDQLVKADRILGGSVTDSDVDKRRREMAADSASKGDGANKADDGKKAVDGRAERLAKQMPIGYVFK